MTQEVSELLRAKYAALQAVEAEMRELPLRRAQLQGQMVGIVEAAGLSWGEANEILGTEFFIDAEEPSGARSG